MIPNTLTRRFNAIGPKMFSSYMSSRQVLPTSKRDIASRHTGFLQVSAPFCEGKSFRMSANDCGKLTDPKRKTDSDINDALVDLQHHDSAPPNLPTERH